MQDTKPTRSRPTKNMKARVSRSQAKIINIGKDLFDVPYIVLAGDEYGIAGIHCTLADDNQVAILSKDQAVTVRGQCNSRDIELP